jgi:hypothetical protein
MLPESYATMTTVARLSNDKLVPNSYALGVSVKKIAGQPAVSHGGSVIGFLSFLIYLPDQEIGVAVISNAFPFPSGGNSEFIAIAIAHAALNNL